MIHLTIRHHVKDYARWKEGFDNHLAARQAGGASGEVWVLRNVDDGHRDDGHQIVVFLGWRDLREARMFTQSVSWQMALQEMGVVGLPEVRFLEEVV